jgi:succinate dehydrogenase flavin-adding protein (antitoxin of CptAB toxin-antitoxin module)
MRDPEDLDQFEAILMAPDPDIFQWLTKKKPLPEDDALLNGSLMAALQAHALTNPLGYKQ